MVNTNFKIARKQTIIGIKVSGELVRLRSRQYDATPLAEAGDIIGNVLRGYPHRLGLEDIEMLQGVRKTALDLSLGRGRADETFILDVHHGFGGSAEDLLEALTATDKGRLDHLLAKGLQPVQVAALCNSNTSTEALKMIRVENASRVIGFVASEAETLRHRKRLRRA